MSPHLRNVKIPNDWDRRGLPGWAYHSPALLELEKEHVFRNHWQIAGHISDVPDPKDRVPGSIAAALAAAAQGVQIVRVHDVAATRQALSVWRAAMFGSDAALA